MAFVNINPEAITRLQGGKYWVKTTLTVMADVIKLQFGFNRPLLNEIKSMAGARWNPEGKFWTVTNSERNWFQLAFLAGHRPYDWYDQVPVKIEFGRPLYTHQGDMVGHGLTYHYGIWGAEMGTGKSLASIEVMERSENEDWLYVGPKSAIASFELELLTWKSKTRPKIVTYEGLKKLVENWPKGKKAPFGVLGDESSRVKNPTSQRSQAMYHLAQAIRKDWGREGYVILMSGSPAPKSPADWWWQCFSADTFVLTAQGPRQIQELAGQKGLEIYFGSQRYISDTGSFISGEKQLFQIVTQEGYSVKVTDGQKMLQDFNGLAIWRETKQLAPGDKLHIHYHKNVSWNGYGSWEQGYLLGHLIGDGTFDGTYGYLGFWPDDYCLIPFVLGLLGEDHQCNPDKVDKISICSKVIHALCREFGLDNSKQITEQLEGASSDFLCGLISGLFDTDGTVEQGRLRISLSQSDLRRLEAVQRILLYLGIPSRIYPTSLAGMRKFQDREVMCKDAFVLTISADHVRTFHDRIGFQHPLKAIALKEQLSIRSQMSQDFTVTIKEIIPLGIEKVWDISVSEVNAFAANGFVAHNCEIACPGFIREGTIEKFKARLGLIVQKESLTGGVYPHLITWKDDENKCAVCGQFESHIDHTAPNEFQVALGQGTLYHQFQKSINEISYLYERMKGLVLVKFKRDCLKELPEKRYRIIECKPRHETLNAAKIITANSTTTIGALTLLRELSDGFQYVNTEIGTETCPSCKGTCLVEQPIPIVGQEELDEAMAELAAHAEQHGWPTGEDGFPIPEHLLLSDKYAMQMLPCWRCDGVGTVLQYSREAVQVPCPKEDALKDILDSHDEDGRLVVYGGFTGSVDRIVQTCEKIAWDWLRVDGRGWSCSPKLGKLSPVQMLQLFQKGQSAFPRVCFVGQASSAGMGLTLTASCEILYYSNDFNAESRVQSEDRIHRMGMDVNKGALITDLIHLPTDLTILENLKKKRRLQDMSLGYVQTALKSLLEGGERRL